MEIPIINCSQVTIMGDVICDLYEPSTSNEFRAEVNIQELYKRVCCKIIKKKHTHPLNSDEK